MTQDERWQLKYNELMFFMKRNHRRPSKYNPEERGKYCNWLHHNKKLLNAGMLTPARAEKFEELLKLTEKYRHKNQWV